MQISLSVIIFSLSIILIDIYVYQNTRIVTRRFPTWLKKSIIIFYFSFSLSTLLLALFFRHILSFIDLPVWRNFFITFFFVGLTCKIFPLLFLLIDDLIRGVKWVYFKMKPFLFPNKQINKNAKLSRKEFLSQTGFYLAAAHISVFGWGILSGAHNYKIHKKIIESPTLPPHFSGIRIVQISDIHAGSFWSKEKMSRGIDMIREQKADMVFFTGDLVNTKTEEVYPYMDLFSKITAPMGVYSILGNHDYGDYYKWEDEEEKKKNFQAMKKAHKDLGWKLLLNENIKISIKEQSIAIIGVENWGAGRFSKYGDIEKACQNTEDLPYKILLSHDPSHWEAEVVNKKTIDLTLSGHTHGMQFGVETENFRWSPAKYRYEQWADLYQKGKQFLYVNRGFGYLGYPGRVGILPEITLIELRTIT